MLRFVHKYPTLPWLVLRTATKKISTKFELKTTIRSDDYTTWIDQVDGVIIAVPTEYHYAIAKDCLERGKHVLLEKPLTKHLYEAEELFEIAKKNNRALHVGHIERFNGAVQELKKNYR